MEETPITRLSPLEVATRLGMRVESLRRRERMGAFPKARRDGRGWRYYTPEDVQALERLLYPNEQRAS